MKMRKPNIILISIDTLRADHLSCYGYHKHTTPNLDKLSSDGTIYRRNFSTGVWTPPGHASMLTGLYVAEHGVYDTRRLSDDIPTIAEILKSNGYQTAGFVNNSQVGELVNFHKGHDKFEEVWKGDKPKSFLERIVLAGMRRIRVKRDCQDMGAKKTNKLFFSWMNNNVDEKKPFYAFLHYIEPHNPLKPMQPFKSRFLDKPSGSIDMKKIEKIAHNPLICFVEDLNPNEEEIQYLKDLYDGEIAYTDSMVGEIVDILKKNGTYDNTMIIITSDHGEHFGEYGLWSHVASLHNEVLNVPLIIKYPKNIECLSEVNEYTQLVDIFPTVVDIAGLSGKVLNKVSGISLKLNREKGNSYHDYVSSEWEGRVPYFIQARLNKDNPDVDLEKIRLQMSMVQTREYKYILKSDGTEIFYKVSNGKEDGTIEVDTVTRDYLRSIIHSRGNTDIQKSGSEEYSINDDIKENLKSLGYM